MICNIVILGENLLNGWCRMRMRPARLVSCAFLYTTCGGIYPLGGEETEKTQKLILPVCRLFPPQVASRKGKCSRFLCFKLLFWIHKTQLYKPAENFLLNFGKVFKFMNVFLEVFSTEMLVNINNFKFDFYLIFKLTFFLNHMVQLFHQGLDLQRLT